MKRIAMLVPLTLAGIVGGACGGDDDTTVPAPAADTGKIWVNGYDKPDAPTFREFELKGPNLYFFCDGTIGVYVTEGSNGDSGKSASPAVVVNHPACLPG
jgi:hypothetical protein